jgi:hypothetical protein
VKVLLDNNLPPSFATALNALSEREGYGSVHHLRDFFDPRITDVDWITELGNDRGWTAVTGDTRIRNRPHELAAFRAAGLVLVALSPSWSKLRFWDKAVLLIRCWPNIHQAAASAPRPSFFEVYARPGASGVRRIA